MTIIHVTENKSLIEETLSEMLEIPREKVFDLDQLLRGLMLLPCNSYMHYDKISGRWIFSNQDEEDWPKWVQIGHKVAGLNFTFCDLTLEMAIGRGLYYFYHTRARE
jgi:hypothetical protein